MALTAFSLYLKFSAVIKASLYPENSLTFFFFSVVMLNHLSISDNPSISTTHLPKKHHCWGALEAKYNTKEKKLGTKLILPSNHLEGETCCPVMGLGKLGQFWNRPVWELWWAAQKTLCGWGKSHSAFDNLNLRPQKLWQKSESRLKSILVSFDGNLPHFFQVAGKIKRCCSRPSLNWNFHLQLGWQRRLGTKYFQINWKVC